MFLSNLNLTTKSSAVSLTVLDCLLQGTQFVSLVPVEWKVTSWEGLL